VWSQTRVPIGEGPECYEKGKAFLRRWGQFQVSAPPPEPAGAGGRCPRPRGGGAVRV